MNSLVIYTSHFGVTKQVAGVIGQHLTMYGPARTVSADEASMLVAPGIDLVVIGGPTEGHTMTEPMMRFLNRLTPDALRGVKVAVFDTRLRWPRWLSGSAALAIERRLRQVGAVPIVPDESFFIKGNGASEHHPPELADGELERARQWAAMVARAAGALSNAGAKS